ncbi:MAG: methyl-accepting chemotaxis protein [Melioribacteraceae bacterium]|nr:methyl-accepting chemotaxis protein [Melioribacteraceae bacterium]
MFGLKFLSSIKNKLYLVIISFYLFVFFAVGMTWNTVNNQKSDGKIINIAGKQRMLSQKMTKELLSSILFSGKVQEAYLKSLSSTAKLFDTSLNNLIVGNKELGLPPTEDQKTINQLTHVRNLWDIFYKNIIVATNSDATVEDKQKALNYVEANNVTLLKEMNKAVGMYESVSSQKTSDLITFLFILIGLATALSLFIAFQIQLLIVKPIKRTVNSIVKISGGDLTVRLEKTNESELDELVVALNTFINNLSTSISDLQIEGNSINHSAAELLSFSTQLAQNAEYEKEQTATIASSIEEISINVSTIASTAEEMSSNALVVTTNTESVKNNSSNVGIAVVKMNDSMNQVMEFAQGANEIAHEAIDLSERGTSTMNMLGTAANEIGKVTEVIKRIAEQTNLLALNATIEAASAGEAGKGFAVVANEIKELANQSAQAAEDIAIRISGVQENTKEAVLVIGDVSGVIEKISASIEQIASSVNTQTRASQDIVVKLDSTQESLTQIVENISEVNVGTNELAKSTNESATGVSEVAQSISVLSEASSENMGGVLQLKDSAEKFKNISEKLIGIVNQFKL